jgi:hypothetical protein
MLFACRFAVCPRRLIANASQHRQTRILGKPRIRSRLLAQVKNRPAVRLHPPHEPAVSAKPHAPLQSFNVRLAHLHRITRAFHANRIVSPAPRFHLQQQYFFYEAEEKFIEYCSDFDRIILNPANSVCYNTVRFQEVLPCRFHASVFALPLRNRSASFSLLL